MKEAGDPVVDAVRDDLLQRSRVGQAKYGVKLDRTDLKLRDWLQHAYEETLDQANYLKRSIMELDATSGRMQRVDGSIAAQLSAAMTENAKLQERVRIAEEQKGR